MDKRMTVESLKARQIYEEIKNLEHPFSKTYTVFEANAELVRQNLRKLIDPSVTIAVRGDTLYIGTKHYRKDRAELRKMIRRLALKCDDENLYDEAMTLLGMEV